LAEKGSDFSPDEEAVERGEVEDAPELVKKALEEEKEKAEKYLANWQRAEADFINYKRRVEQERTEMIGSANASLIMALLPVLDDFERALGNVSDNLDEPSWVEGMRLIYRKLKTVLEERGLSEVIAEGEDFDPNVHEAVMCVDGEEGKVCGEVQKGYMLRDRLLRPSMVKVGKEGPGSVDDRE
jgi:molecular chaperone GrpE